MKLHIPSLVLAFGLTSSGMQATALEQQCPVSLKQISLGYNHEGGQSKPQLRVNFANQAGKEISTVTFSLSVLDSAGSPREYSDDLVYRDGLGVGKTKLFAWDLTPESIDIHRTGETVLLQKVEFSDSTVWTDDGSQSCVLTVDYHPM